MGFFEVPTGGRIQHRNHTVPRSGAEAPGYGRWRARRHGAVALAVLLLGACADRPGADRPELLPACDPPYIHTYEIQGRGAATPFDGQVVTTQGVVVGDYEGAAPALRGFYLQDTDGDGDAATSDGLFVFNGDDDAVAVGDIVRVTGRAEEFRAQTQLGAVSSLIQCGRGGAVSPVDVTLPFPDPEYPERYEGMLVRLPQTLYVTGLGGLGRFGEIVLSSGGRLPTPTALAFPGAAADSVQAANDLDRLLIDDASSGQNPDPIPFGPGAARLSPANPLRGGDSAAGITGVMTYTWAGHAASGDAWRVRPGGVSPAFVAASPRPAVPEAVGGTLRVASFNLLNWFNTFSGCTSGVRGEATDCRGAGDAAEFERQARKTVSAIVGLDADVIGVMELENDGYGSGSSIAALVDRLNGETAPGTYALIDVDAATGQINALGRDAIRVGIIYRPGAVTPVGRTAVLNSLDFVTGGDSELRNRPALAQAFEQSNHARLVVAVTHLKSKGQACDAPATGDGQGECSVVRTHAARLLATWLAGDPTGGGDPDVLIIGDLNAYTLESPIRTLVSAGFTDLIATRIGPSAYSYVFDGQWGYLDYALASHDLEPQVTGITVWHINADEPAFFGYDTSFKSDDQIDLLYAPDPFRSSDHDPVLIGLGLGPPPVGRSPD
jgi:predicted extracellular nuclease